MTAAIAAQGAGVHFFFDRQRRVTTPFAARLRRRGTETWGLRDVSFEIAPGSCVALLGPTGSGKTTLLRTVAGVLRPDEGRLDVRGRVGSLLATDAGLMPALTGRENALLLGVLAGLTRARARSLLERVRVHSGLHAEFDRPVSSYSQGMRARLGFAVAVETEPEILLLDEVHEALDHEFRRRVEAHAQEIRAAGGIVVAAGHDHGLLEGICDRALLLRDGHVAAEGEFERVRRGYRDEPAPQPDSGG